LHCHGKPNPAPLFARNEGLNRVLMLHAAGAERRVPQASSRHDLLKHARGKTQITVLVWIEQAARYNRN